MRRSPPRTTTGSARTARPVEQALATIRAHIGHVQIDGGVPGAQVDGQRPGRRAGCRWPTRLPVSAGPVDIEVRAVGYRAGGEDVNVAAGELRAVPFTLQQSRGRQRAAAAAAARDRARQPVAVRPLSAPGCRAAPADRTIPIAGRGERMAGIGIIAGGVVAIGGGVAASSIAKHKFDAISADAAAGRPYNEATATGRGYETGAGVLYVVGGAAIVGRCRPLRRGRPRNGESRPPRGRLRRPADPSPRPGARAPRLAVRF